MARFVVYVTEKRKRKTVVDVTGASLDIGSRSTCALTVKDPVAAERHCVISADAGAGTFSVKDLGTTTGTYVNGLRVTAGSPLGDGDALVLGTTRLLASVEPGEGGEGPVLNLELQEKAFQFQRAEYVRQTGDWIQGDRERWVESEVTFSRFPALRGAVWGSLLLVLVAPLLLVNKGLRARTFEPGPLSAGHAALLDGTSPLLALHAEAAAEGCQACHEPLNGTPIDNCFACHESSRYSHPFPDEAGLAGGSPYSCLECHLEHRGGSTERSQVALGGIWEGHMVTVPVRTGGFVPTADAAMCERCHEGLAFDEARQAEILASLGAYEAGTRTVKVAYDGFSHASHAGAVDAGGAAIACKTCHVPAEARDSELAHGSAVAERDFRPVEFEGCMGCHGTADMDPGLRHPIARSGSAPEAPEAPAFPVAWHGAAADPGQCQVCHAEAYAKEMRTVPRERFEYVDAAGQPIARAADDPMLLFAYSIRHHTAEFEAAMAGLDPNARGSDDDCARCHVDGDWITAGEAREGRFYHALHLAEALTTDEVRGIGSEEGGPGRLAASAAACDECHSLVPETSALAEPFYRAEDGSCAACHRTSPGDESSVPRLIEAAARMQHAETTTRVAFPHDAHTGSDHPTLAAGCYACHGFEKSAVAFRDPIVTPDDVKNCKRCHDADHQALAGGSCARCHVPGDPVYTTPLADAAWPLTKSWPAPNTFSHFSSGHMAAVESDCARCHTAVDAAGTITDVRLPIETDDACRTCHIEEMGRFHWR